jgi:hypothetical protein
MLVVEVKGLRFHLGQWGMGLHLTADRSPPQFEMSVAITCSENWGRSEIFL